MPLNRRSVLAVPLVLLSLGAAAAHAADGPPARRREGVLAPTSLGSSDAGDVVEARRCYRRAIAHYNLQEYKEAIAEFQQGYRLHPDGVFLYNIAQAFRLSGTYERALFFYRAYLRAEPEAGNRAEVDGRIVELEAALATTKHPPDGPIKLGGVKPATDDPTAARPPGAADATANSGVANGSTTSLTATSTTSGGAAHSDNSNTQSALTLTGQSAAPRKPIYKKWWLWTAVGVATTALVVGIAVGASAGKHDSTLSPVAIGGN